MVNQALQFIQTLIASIDWTQVSIGAVIGALIFSALVSFLPNALMYKWGSMLGSKLSSEGRKALGKGSWEKLENNLVGSFVSLAAGIKDGADADDAS